MNPENPDTTFPVIVERWRSREEIRKEYLDHLGPEELRQISPADYWVKYGLPAWQREQARKYSPSQPRVPAGNPDGGQWTMVGGNRDRSNLVDSSTAAVDKVLLADAGSHARSSAVMNDANPMIMLRSSPAAMSSRAFCEAQWNRDIFHCKMVGLPSCYAQAMVRLVACEKGQPIPPLNY